MGEIEEFALPVQVFLKAYRWRRVDPAAWTPLRRPLSDCRFALVSSAGFVLPGQSPFDASIHGGDTSFREIPRDADLSTLLESHRSGAFDHAGIRRDPNLAFPLERVREMAAEGRVGSISGFHLSFMGSITAPERLTKRTAPEAARRLVEEGVDAALLVPV